MSPRSARGSPPAGRIGLREPGLFRWAWRRIATEVPDLRPDQANLVFEDERHTDRVIARLIVERRGLDVRAAGDDPVDAIENLVRALAGSVRRAGAEIYRDWRQAQRDLAAAPAGSPEARRQIAEMGRLRAEYAALAEEARARLKRRTQDVRRP